jgi:hypothetical protein
MHAYIPCILSTIQAENEHRTSPDGRVRIGSCPYLRVRVGVRVGVRVRVRVR